MSDTGDDDDAGREGVGAGFEDEGPDQLDEEEMGEVGPGELLFPAVFSDRVRLGVVDDGVGDHNLKIDIGTSIGRNRVATTKNSYVDGLPNGVDFSCSIADRFERGDIDDDLADFSTGVVGQDFILDLLEPRGQNDRR